MGQASSGLAPNPPFRSGDPEIPLTGRFLLRGLDRLDPGPRWALPTPRHEPVDALLLPLEYGFHASVRQVPNEPSDPSRAGPLGNASGTPA